MQVEFEPLEGQLRKVRVTFNKDEVREVTDVEARELAKKVRIPGGYTKLKAKTSRVKQVPAFREQIFMQSMEGLVQKAAEEGLKELDFDTIGRPEVEELPDLKSFNQELTIEVLLEEKPKPETLVYKDLEYPPAAEVEVTSEDVDGALDEELERLTKYEDADETVALVDGDLALLHISISDGDEKLEVPGTETLAAVVGSTDDRPPPYFKEIAPTLTGTKKGDEGDLDFNWPEGETEPEVVAGKSVKVHWLIHLARHKVRPEFNDEFVQEITQGKETSMLAYRGLLRERLKETKESELEGEHMEKVIDVIIEANPFPMPARLLERSVNDRWEALQKRIAEGEMPAPEEDPETYEKEQRETFTTEITRDLQKTLLVAQIMEAESIEPDMDAVGQQAQALMGGMGGNKDDPQTQNMFYQVLTHLTNKDIESKVYRRIMGKDEPAEDDPSRGASDPDSEEEESATATATATSTSTSTDEESGDA